MFSHALAVNTDAGFVHSLAPPPPPPSQPQRISQYISSRLNLLLLIPVSPTQSPALVSLMSPILLRHTFQLLVAFLTSIQDPAYHNISRPALLCTAFWYARVEARINISLRSFFTISTLHFFMLQVRQITPQH